ncbi:MAG: phosphotriesterase, partial [Mariniphaga sp.]|nr:phosphotriesterase [Mariniphaga sp.]
EQDHTKHIEAAQLGAWIAFDNFHEGRLERFVSLLKSMKEKGLLNKVLLSHDSGWFDPAKPEGGDFKGFMLIENLLIPELKENGFTQDNIDQILINNPTEVFTVKVRKI